MTKAKKRKAPRSSAELSTLDDFLKEIGKFEEFQAIAIKEVLAWQIAKGTRAAKSRSPKLTRPPTRSD
jgi:antitoxin HicB